MAKLSFLPHLPHSPTCMGPSLLCALLHWRMCQNYHFHHTGRIRHIRQLHYLCFGLLVNVAKLSFTPYLPHSPTCMGPLIGDCGRTRIVIFAILGKFATFANLYRLPHSFVLCLIGDCGKIVIFAILVKFANFSV